MNRHLPNLPFVQRIPPQRPIHIIPHRPRQHRPCHSHHQHHNQQDKHPSCPPSPRDGSIRPFAPPDTHYSYVTSPSSSWSSMGQLPKEPPGTQWKSRFRIGIPPIPISLWVQTSGLTVHGCSAT